MLKYLLDEIINSVKAFNLVEKYLYLCMLCEWFNNYKVKREMNNNVKYSELLFIAVEK